MGFKKFHLGGNFVLSNEKTQPINLGSNQDNDLIFYLHLSGANQYVFGGANFFTGDIRGVLFRWIPFEHGPNAVRVIVGTNVLAGPGGFMLLGDAYNGQPAATQGRHATFNGVYNVASAVNVDIVATGAIGRVFNDFIYLRSGSATASGSLHLYRNGYQVATGSATNLSNLDSSEQIGINTRTNAIGTLPFGNMGVIELQCITASNLTDAEIYNICRSKVGTSFDSKVRHFVASDLNLALTSAWRDRVGGLNLTVTASFGVKTFPRYMVSRDDAGIMEVFGDSIAAGRISSGTLDGGWRRHVLYLVNQQKHLTANGQSTFTFASTPLDFSARHTAVGGQTIGINNGTTPRIDTVETDRVASVPPNAITILAYGTNDLNYRTVTLAQSVSTAVSATFAGFELEISGLRVVRTGPIIIPTVLRVSSTSNSNYKQSIEAFNAELTGTRYSQWNQQFGSIYITDVVSLVCPTISGADDKTKFWDDVHLTDYANGLYASGIAQTILSIPR